MKTYADNPEKQSVTCWYTMIQYTQNTSYSKKKDKSLKNVDLKTLCTQS